MNTAKYVKRINRLLPGYETLAAETAQKVSSRKGLPVFYNLFAAILYQRDGNVLQRIESVLTSGYQKLEQLVSLRPNADTTADTGGTPADTGRTPADAGEASSDAIKRVVALYGTCWKDFDEYLLFEEPRQLLSKRFARNGIDTARFKGDLALDDGCGSGRYTVALKHLGFRTVIGIDLGEAALRQTQELLKQRGIAGISFCEGSVLQLPYDDDSFDFVFCNGVLHHTTDTQQGLNEIYRALRPGGQAWIYVYNRDGLYWKIRKMLRRILKHVPREESYTVLQEMELPMGKIFMFMDSCYVDIENNYSKSRFEIMLRNTGFKRLIFLSRGADHDLSEAASTGSEETRAVYGRFGDLRFLAGK